MRPVSIVIVLFLNLFHANGQSGIPLHLLPVPAKITWQEGRFPLTASFTVTLKSDKYDTVLYAGASRFFQTLNRRTARYFNTRYINDSIKPDSASMIIVVHSKAVANTGIDESYSLDISSKVIQLDAPSIEGALHGLETILQLVYDEDGSYYLPSLTINDSPRFGWRGLMIDVARHFIPIEVIERNLDAMAAVKMNVLHLHLSDDEGFRVESKLFPLLQTNGSNGEYYTQAEIKQLVLYAKLRGIMVVPEFDMPGHTTSWFAGYTQLASAPGPYAPGPRFKNLNTQLSIAEIMKMINNTPTATMDPSKESTYHFLDKFFGEMASLFPSAYVHIGCDENNGVAWMNNPSIVSFMKKNGFADAHALQAYFAKRVNEVLKKHKKLTIGWEEILSGNLSKDVTVQVWNDASYLKKALANGNPVVVSKGFYLDLFIPAYVHYNNEIIPGGLADSSTQLISGAEAALWSEAVDRNNIDTRIWPRAAAIAERLWSPATLKDVDDLYRRLFLVNSQLDEIGLQQISSYEKNLRRLTGGKDIIPLKTLTDVLTPVKGYKKLFAKMGKPAGYTYQTAPLTAVSDIIPVDSEIKRRFRKLVANYLKDKAAGTEGQLIKQLIQWRDNEIALQPYFSQSELISEVKKHGENLYEAALIGLEAIDKIKTGALPSAEWLTEKMSKLKDFRKPYSETELDIIPEIEGLVKQQLSAEPASYPMF